MEYYGAILFSLFMTQCIFLLSVLVFMIIIVRKIFVKVGNPG